MAVRPGRDGPFQPADLPPAVAALTVAGLCAVVVLATAAVWAAGGAALNRGVDDPRARRAVNAALGLVLAASVAFIWV